MFEPVYDVDELFGELTQYRDDPDTLTLDTRV